MAKSDKTVKSGEVKKVTPKVEEQVLLKHRNGRTANVPKSRWEKNKASYLREGYKLATVDEIKATHVVETIIPQETTEMQEKGD